MFRGSAITNPTNRIPVPIVYNERSVLDHAEYYANPNNIRDFSQTLNYLQWALDQAESRHYSPYTVNRLQQLLDRVDEEGYETGITESRIAYDILYGEVTISAAIRALEQFRNASLTRVGRSKADEYIRTLRQRLRPRN